MGSWEPWPLGWGGFFKFPGASGFPKAFVEGPRGCLGSQELLGFQEVKLPGFSGPSGTPGGFGSGKRAPGCQQENMYQKCI